MSDWITSKICHSISCDILSEIVGCHYLFYISLDNMWLYAACDTPRIKPYSKFSFGGGGGGEVYCQKYCRKSRLTALLTNCHNTKFQTPYLTIYFPKWKFWRQLSFNISSEIVWGHKLCHVTRGFQVGFLVSVIFPYCVLGQVWYLIVLIPDLCPLPYLK